MRFAIVDLGTNSVRFDVHEVLPDGVVIRLHREKLMVRLGQNLFTKGRLDPEAMERTVYAFRGFQKTAKMLGVERFAAFATSAVRDASDGLALVRKIKRATGIELRVISGKDEALFIARGILRNEPRAAGAVALVDIGGGSTEVSLCRKGKILFSHSFDLGVARIHQVFLKSSPPPKAKKGQDPVDMVRAFVREQLKEKLDAEGWPKGARIKRIVGSSGTARALVKLHRRRTGEKKPLTPRALGALVEDMRRMTLPQLLRLPGMEANRADLILAGTVVLEEIARVLNVKEIVATEFSLRDGLLEEELRILKRHKTGGPKNGPSSALGLEDLIRRAKAFHVHEGHLRQVAALTHTLFEATKALHKLDGAYKEALMAAAILHDIGRAVNPVGHDIHSAYMIQNMNFGKLDPFRHDFIAELARWHMGDKIKAEDLKWCPAGTKRQAFLKCLALLRVADALDRGHKSHVRIKRVRVTRARVEVVIEKGSPAELEILRAEQKRELFERVFRRELVVRR